MRFENFEHGDSKELKALDKVDSDRDILVNS